MGLLKNIIFGSAEERANRVRYNAIVEDFVKSGFGIDLDHISNSNYNRFQFEKNIHKIYNSGLNTNEAIATVVGDYIQGMLHKSGITDDATNLARKAIMFVEECRGRGEFDKRRADIFFSVTQNMAEQQISAGRYHTA